MSTTAVPHPKPKQFFQLKQPPIEFEQRFVELKPQFLELKYYVQLKQPPIEFK
jgi:hypothetical protein